MMESTSVIRPFFMSKDCSLSDRILNILGINPHLTAKQICLFVKSKFGAVPTYQSIHKTLGDLVKKGVLRKENNLYAISQSWVDFIEHFAELVREANKRGNEFKMNLAAKRDGKIKVISFDLDGCLSDNTFDDIFWDREVPKLFAQKKNVSFEESYKFVVNEYKRLWGKTDGWRDPDFWLKHFGIKETWEEIINHIRGEIKHYGDSIPVLKNLQRTYTLIITSHADRKFLDLKLNVENLRSFFDYTFSTPTDFNNMKKDSEVYKKICRILTVKPTEVVHIGDHYMFDYVVPTSVGIKSFLIDRSGKLKEDYAVRSLYDFESRVLELS